LILGSVLVAVLALVFVGMIPPYSNFFYYYYSNYWPPGRAMKIIEHSNGALSFITIRAGLSVGLFSLLDAQGPMTELEIAQKLQIQPGPTHVVLDGLCSFDILEVDANAKYKLTPAAAAHLVPGKPGYFGSFFALAFHVLPSLMNMEKILRHGRSAEFLDAPDHPFWQSFSREMFEPSAAPAQALVNLVKDWANSKPSLRVLDMAASHGRYGYTVASNVKNARVWFFDFPPVIKVTASNADKFPEIDKKRLNYIGGDIWKDSALPEDGEKYDLIVVSHFYHAFNTTLNLKVSEIFGKSLKVGGKLVINDFVLEEGRPSMFENRQPRVFSLVMLTNTEGGASYTFSSFKSFLEPAGFGDISLHHNLPSPNSYIVATKVK